MNSAPDVTAIADIVWDHLELSNEQQPVVGSGSFGVVVRAKYAFRGKRIQQFDVAVKIMTKKFWNDVVKYESIRDQAWSEANTMYRAGVSVQQSDSVVKLYGVVEGPLPPTWQTGLRIYSGTDTVIGIVMKYEAGGSLESLLHGGSKRDLDMTEKVRILRGIALGLSELHSLPAGDYIVHGDIKPANVLLGGETPCAVKLADFGVSKVKESLRNTYQMTTSLRVTDTRRGTPVYSAPELLPSANCQQVCAPRRGSDMYAFAVLAWEVLTGERPFQDITREVTLCMTVHSGGRPDLKMLPTHTPPNIVEMIRSGFEAEPKKRMNANESFMLLEHAYLCLSDPHFDIYFSHSWKDKSFLKHVIALFTAEGLKVWYDVLENSWDLDKSINKGVRNCSVVMACVNSTYQSSLNCMTELKMANAIDNPKKPVVSLVMESAPKDWASDELRSFCSFEADLSCDISDFAALGDTAWENPSPDMIIELKKLLQPMILILEDLRYEMYMY
jgi:serine/threonine protein kinase